MSNNKITDLPTPVFDGLYQNVYREIKTGKIILSVSWYESPREAESNIMWTLDVIEYLYTAKVTSSIHKFERPKE